MDMYHYILAFAWVVYCVLHSVLAAASVKTVMGKWLGKNFRYYRFAYTIFSFVGLVAILLYQVNITSPLLFQSNGIVQWTGIIFAAFGASFVLLNIFKYFMQLSGVQWLTQENPAAKLERKGFHKYVRHPLYLSTFVFIWGLWLVYPYLSLLIANVIITIYTLIGIGFEEKKLINEFGDEYKTYQQEVPKIIPWLRKNHKL
jgi:methanethiol S-methyltransferase